MTTARHGRRPASPPQSRFDRHPPAVLLARRGESRRVLFVIIAIVLTIAGLGLVGTSALLTYRARQAVIDRMGPMMVAPLPSVTVRVGNGREIDIEARLELRDGVEAGSVAINEDRLRDRMVDRLSGYGSDALEGTAGAKLVKDALGAAVQMQTGPETVKNILIDRLTIR
jgi:flagellar basal body-associated protein FliL